MPETKGGGGEKYLTHKLVERLSVVPTVTSPTILLGQGLNNRYQTPKINHST